MDRPIQGYLLIWSTSISRYMGVPASNDLQGVAANYADCLCFENDWDGDTPDTDVLILTIRGHTGPDTMWRVTRVREWTYTAEPYEDEA